MSLATLFDYLSGVICATQRHHCMSNIIGIPSMAIQSILQRAEPTVNRCLAN